MTMRTLTQILQRRSPVLCVLEHTHTVADAVQQLAARQLGALLVVDREDRVMGIFSERDLLRRVVAEGRAPEHTALAEVMTRNPVTASPSEDRESALLKMQRAGCRHLPVVVDGMVIDMLSMRDLIFVELEERASEVDQLKAYIQGSY
jgi:signal-transduction protein with cAMP-binding, CBS, and nucleotidyltransferase domain